MHLSAFGIIVDGEEPFVQLKTWKSRIEMLFLQKSSNRSLMNLQFLRLGVLAFCFACISISVFGQKEAGNYYVLANAGLNLRATEASNSEKLMTVNYGEAVEIVQAAKSKGMLVDGIAGGMAKVQYQGKTGYMFDGFLARFPAPIAGQDLDKYIGRVWESEIDAMNEDVNRDYNGYLQSENAIYISEITWSDAFLLAKNQFGIPAPFHFPGDKGTGEQTTKNPNVDKNAWSDDFTATYENGKLVSLRYSYRAEGFGKAVIVEPAKRDNYQFRIYELNIAD